MFACRYSFVFGNWFTLVLFSPAVPFSQTFKSFCFTCSCLYRGVSVSDGLFSFPDFHLSVCSGIRFFSLFVTKLKEREAGQWKCTCLNAALFSFINFLWLLNLKLACQCEMISLYLTVSFQYRLELFLTKEAWIAGNYILNARLFV